MSKSMLTLMPDLVRHRADTAPSRTAYRFFQSAALAPDELSYAALWQAAAALAHCLQERGLQTERVLLVCKSQSNFVIGFFACLLAGVVAVPTTVPRREALLNRFQLLIRDA